MASQDNKVKMNGKIVLITGATSGIGKATAIQLAELGARVVIGGRNKEKTARVVQEIRHLTGNQEVDFLMVNLASQSSVRRLAQDFEERYGDLDVLINNAGTFSVSRKVTEDGMEYTLAVNYLSRFLLSHLLLPLLKKNAPSRIINVSGKYHSRGKIHFDDPHLKNGYHWSTANNQSKLADVLFTYALARRLKGTGVTVNCLDPGATRTNTVLKDPKLPWGLRYSYRLFRIFFQSPEQGASTSVLLASEPELAKVSGKYFVKGKSTASSETTYNTDLQEELWDLSQNLSQLSEEERVALPS